MTVHVRGSRLILFLVLFWVSYLRYLGGISNVQAMPETGLLFWTLGHIVTYGNADGLAWLTEVVITRYTLSVQALCIPIQLRSRIRMGRLPPDLSRAYIVPFVFVVRYFVCFVYIFLFVFYKCGWFSWYTNICYLAHYNLFMSSVLSRGLHSFSTYCFPALFPCLLLAVLLYRESNSLLRFKNIRLRSLTNSRIMELRKMFLEESLLWIPWLSPV